MRPWYLDPNKVRAVANRIASRTNYVELHAKLESIMDNVWRKGELYCHRERMFVDGCSEACSLCRPNH